MVVKKAAVFSGFFICVPLLKRLFGFSQNGIFCNLHDNLHGL